MSFDRLAPHYRWMEVVLAGRKLQRCRMALLPEVPVPRRVLMLGEGTGQCLVELLQRFPAAHFTCVDSSAAMIAQMKKRVSSTERIDWINEDIRRWDAGAAAFDLLVSHFFFDCFSSRTLDELVPRLGAAAAPGAAWLIADFCAPASTLARLRAKAILWAMYRFFRVATGLEAVRLTAPDAWLERSGFVLCRRERFEWGLLQSDLWRLEQIGRELGQL